MMNYTYIVKCADGTLYTGWTNCLQKRMKAHNEGKNGAKSQGIKQLMAGGGVVLIGTQLVPLLSGLFS